MAVAATEFLDPAGRIEDFLLAGIERVAFRANIDVQLAFVRRARLKGVSTTANNLHNVIVRMNFCLHGVSSSLSLGEPGSIEGCGSRLNWLRVHPIRVD